MLYRRYGKFAIGSNRISRKAFFELEKSVWRENLGTRLTSFSYCSCVTNPLHNFLDDFYLDRHEVTSDPKGFQNPLGSPFRGGLTAQVVRHRARSLAAKSVSFSGGGAVCCAVNS